MVAPLYLWIVMKKIIFEKEFYKFSLYLVNEYIVLVRFFTKNFVN